MNPIIYQASISGLLDVIFVIVIVYYAFSFLFRYLIPLLMRKYVNDFQNQFTRENQRSHEDMNWKKEGEISIKFVDKDKNKNQHPDDGEYVDYEEIK